MSGVCLFVCLFDPSAFTPTVSLMRPVICCRLPEICASGPTRTWSFDAALLTVPGIMAEWHGSTMECVLGSIAEQVA